MPLLIRLPLKTFSTGGTREHFTITVLFLLVPRQVPFHFERLSTLKAIECGEKWEVGVNAFKVHFQVSLQSEGFLTLSTLPLLLFGEKSMRLFNVSTHFFNSSKLFPAMGAMVLLSWFLEWVLGWYSMDLSHVSFAILRGDGNLANITFSHHQCFLIASLAASVALSVFYKLTEVGKPL